MNQSKPATMFAIALFAIITAGVNEAVSMLIHHRFTATFIAVGISMYLIAVVIAGAFDRAAKNQKQQ